MATIAVDLEKLRILETGLGQYCLELSRELEANRGPNENLTFFVPPNRMNLFDGSRAIIKPVHRWAKRGLVRPLQRLARVAPGPVYDVWHMTNQASRYEPWNPRVPVLLTIHDLNFLREKPQAAQQHLADLQRRIDRAARVTTISNFVADEIRRQLELSGKKLDVVYNGATAPKGDSLSRPHYAPDRPFLFSIGDFAPKKNFHALVEMLVHLPEFCLVVAGKNDKPYGDVLRGAAARCGVADRVVLPGPVSGNDRNWLYQNCRAFVFPSLTEGFGLPPLEAMSAGKPTFLSDRTSLPEVGGDAASYWEHFEPKYMADVLRAGLSAFDSDSSSAKRLRTHSQRFSWRQAALQYLDIYREMIASPVAPASPRPQPRTGRAA